MAAPVLERSYTPEEFLLLADARRYELVDGCLLERAMSRTSSQIAAIITAMLVAATQARRLGEVYTADLGIQIFPNRRDVRFADVSFIRSDRAPVEEQGYLQVAPDLVVEVVSPGNTADEVVEKALLWLSAGVRLVWVVYPHARQVHVYRASGHHAILTAGDQLDGEDVVPGFATPVGEIFPERPPAA